jgi:hypothetical protein
MDKDIVIDLIDAIHDEQAVAESARLSKLLRAAAEEIQNLRLCMAFPPMDIDDEDEARFPATVGSG